MTEQGAVTFELWSRQSRLNVDVDGMARCSAETRTLYPTVIKAADRELRTLAFLVPQPTKSFPDTVLVIVAGRRIGFLPKSVAPDYRPVLNTLIESGLTPVTPCRIYAHETRIDLRASWLGRGRWNTHFNVMARVLLDEPHLIAPVNPVPRQAHRLLPPGVAVQLKDEEHHLDVLAPLVGDRGQAWVLATLHLASAKPGGGELVEVRVGDEPVGVLTAAMSRHYAPTIAHLDGDGVRAAARVLLTGNPLSVEGTLYAARAHELAAGWFEGAPTWSTVSTLRPVTHTIADLEAAVDIPRRPTRILFNPPPGWPVAADEAGPGPGWQPDPSWAAPPEGWEFWVAR